MSPRHALVVFVLCVFAGVVRGDPFNITVAAPAGCHGNACKLYLTVIPVQQGAKFMLEAAAKEYVAVAIAGSGMMGVDSVIECVKSKNPDHPVDFYHSTNGGPPVTPGRSNKRDAHQNIDNIAKNRTGVYKDDRISCSFILSNTTKFPNTIVEMTKTRYFLQIVSGNEPSSADNISKHNQWAVTLRAVSLKKDEGKLRTVDNVPKNGAAAKLTTSGLALAMVVILKAWI